MQGKEFAEYMMEQFAVLQDVSNRAMMGGYIFYYKDKVFGGIYDPGFMVKITKASKKFLTEDEIMPPYQGAKDMILVECTEDRDLLCNMVREMYEDLPVPKVKKKKSDSRI